MVISEVSHSWFDWYRIQFWEREGVGNIVAIIELCKVLRIHDLCICIVLILSPNETSG